MEVTNLTWRKSSRSGNGGGNCVEVASDDRRVHVRDTKSRQRGMLTVSAAAWRQFVNEIKTSRADIPALSRTGTEAQLKSPLVTAVVDRDLGCVAAGQAFRPGGVSR